MAEIMRIRATLVTVFGILALLAGCSGKDGDLPNNNEKGAEAAQPNKTFSKEDAKAATPTRAGSENSDR